MPATESPLASAPVRSTPPQEIRIAILLQAILFLVHFIIGLEAYTLFSATTAHPVAASVIMVILGGIWSLWLGGLWWRRNWVRWLTVILNVLVLSETLRISIAHGRGPDILGYVLVAIRVAVIVMFLRPVAGNWYGRKAG